MSEAVEIFEVGPRDGLQNETRMIPTVEKIGLVDLLSQAGFRRIEVASFVSPKWVPQMADGAQVLAGIKRVSGVSYAALTPNMRGYEAARDAGADEIAVFASASEGFSRANINCSISESFDRFKPIIAAAKVAEIPVRGYVSCVTDCPFDGATDPAQVAKVAAALFDAGCYEVSLGDTLGRATPEAIQKMLEAVLDGMPVRAVAGHYHDTSGQALANIEVSVDLGVRVFDAAVGGLGGCPYAPGAAGNVATEKVAARLAEMELTSGLDRDVLERAAEMARTMRSAP